MKYKGGCHCGHVAYEVEGEITELIDCNCSICSKIGSVLWFIPKHQFKMLSIEENVASYTFGTGSIKHNFCPKCGIHPFGEAVGLENGSMIAINVRCLDDVDFSTLPIKHYDGRSL